jgi:protein ImuA
MVLTPRLAPSDAAIFPQACESLEEAAAASPADVGAALAFALDRLAGADAAGRPVALVLTRPWLRERGRPFAQGIDAQGLDRRGLTPDRLLLVRAEREAEALWALEEALKSGAVAGGLVTAERASLTATRRLDFAARAGGAAGVVLRTTGEGELSAARRRWRIAALASGPNDFDAAAPGAPRLRAELVRRRDGPPAAWDLELDDETHRLRVAAGLADHGVAEAGALHRQRRSATAA